MEGNETRGRPRDPLATDRIMAAALDEYARHGWSGFSMRGVAQSAGVGKSSLYLRWSSKEQLLVDSVVAGAAHLADRTDTGTLYDDVTAWATDLFEYFLEPSGWTAVRITVDAVAGIATLDGIRARVTEPLIETSTAIFQRALRRGEISTEAASLDVAECLFGSVLMHVMNLAPGSHHDAKLNARQHVRPFIDIVLTGIGAQIPSTDPD
ncbi:TetR/AcrR family transcriptional regulator [Mycolicibacterium sp. GESEQ-9]|uniref:TetR/AcrR family transcriptional regulator n=1 Tax=Mycolicibacterium sp. GESEQ-9 TaxID=2812656 RepID=UPI001B320E83|nr:TetR/AcrR family transcriptional regulator [Mycolicibacterium sp. GESEQ-9]